MQGGLKNLFVIDFLLICIGLENVVCVLTMFRDVLKLGLSPRIWPVFTNVLYMLEKNPAFLGSKSGYLIVLFNIFKKNFCIAWFII